MSNDLSDLSAQIDPLLIEQAMKLIGPARRIALLAHEHPDGDCIGSALGLTHILQQTGKTCVPVCVDPAPKTLDFLPGIGQFQRGLGDEDFDLVIALDAGELSRFGPLYERHQEFLDRVNILNIDHHISSSGCGIVNIIDPTAAATGELLVLFQRQSSLPLSKEAAVCLLTGIITDTSSFQFTNTTARTMQVAAALLQAGAVPEPIVQHIYRSRPLSQLRFLGQSDRQCRDSLRRSAHVVICHRGHAARDRGNCRNGRQLRGYDARCRWRANRGLLQKLRRTRHHAGEPARGSALQRGRDLSALRRWWPRPRRRCHHSRPPRNGHAKLCQ